MAVFTPTDPTFLHDPYPTYARLRRDAPIFFYEPWGKWVLTRHEDISALLRDKRLGRVLENVNPTPNPAHAPFEAVQQGSLLELEPPTTPASGVRCKTRLPPNTCSRSKAVSLGFATGWPKR